MLLNQTAEYALRAMVWIALLEPGKAIRARDLAEVTAIPQHYISKILRRMVVRGLLQSRRGVGGGFRLSRPARDITFCEVLDAVDAAPDGGGCVFGFEACDLERPCPLHDSWSAVSAMFYEWATGTTLADVQPDGVESVLARLAEPRDTKRRR